VIKRLAKAAQEAAKNLTLSKEIEI